jgi:hypothetical protein
MRDAFALEVCKSRMRERNMVEYQCCHSLFWVLFHPDHENANALVMDERFVMSFCPRTLVSRPSIGCVDLKNLRYI